MERYFKALDKIRELEDELQRRGQIEFDLRRQVEDVQRDYDAYRNETERRLTEQAVSLAMAGKASAEVQRDDLAEINSYKRENARLLEFVQQIADTKSKFAKSARALLGQS